VLMSTVVVDILLPARDRVRASGANDDPAGGVLDGAPDRLVVTWRGAERHPAEEATASLGMITKSFRCRSAKKSS
jgi:hypothetical protein